MILHLVGNTRFCQHVLKDYVSIEFTFVCWQRSLKFRP